ncbi:MAG: YybH family protein [Bacteroidota bacterium]
MFRTKFQMLLFSIFLSVGCSGVLAQNNQENMAEINRQVWYPFYKAYETLDAELFASLHDTAIFRIPADNKTIETYSEYISGLENWFAQNLKDNRQLNIEFRFFERINNNLTASERGIYKFSMRAPGTEEVVFYGKFHVILQKENGVWKIRMDYDSNEGGTIGEDDYMAARAIDDFTGF